MQSTTDLVELLEQRSEQLRPFFKPQMLGRPHTLFSFIFDDGLPFCLEVNETEFNFRAGVPEAPTITLYVSDHSTCWQLLSGATDSMAAFMAGRYRADGNIVLSQLLLYLFHNDDPTIAYEVRD